MSDAIAASLTFLRALPFIVEVATVWTLSLFLCRWFKPSTTYFSRYWRSFLASLAILPITLAAVFCTLWALRRIYDANGYDYAVVEDVKFLFGVIGRSVLIWPFAIAWKVMRSTSGVAAQTPHPRQENLSEPTKIVAIVAASPLTIPTLVAKPFKILLGGILAAAATFGIFQLLIVHLQSSVEILVEICRAGNERVQDSVTQYPWENDPLVCDPIELETMIAPVGIQAQIAEAQHLLATYSHWPQRLSFFIVIACAMPLLWYFLLQRIRELRHAIVGK